MGWFNFGKKHQDSDDQVETDLAATNTVGEEDSAVENSDVDATAEDDSIAKEDSAIEDSGTADGDDSDEEHGPWDSEDEDVIDYDDYLDIGSLFLPYLKGIELRLKANSQTREILGVTITLGKSSLELEPYAAPKTLGLWDDIRQELCEGNVDAEEVDGKFGKELLLPVTIKNKQMLTRIVGVDGPRWMLRGIFSGPAAKGGPERESLDQYFSDIVVVRGQEPLAPRDLLPLHAPLTPAERQAAAEAEQAADDEHDPHIPDRPEGPFDSDQQTEVKTTLSRGPMFSEVR